MVLAIKKIVWQKEDFKDPVFVAWIDRGAGRPCLVSAADKTVYLFFPNTMGYLETSRAAAGNTVLSLAAEPPPASTSLIFAGLEDRIEVYSADGFALRKAGETEPEPGANFADLAVADIDGDGTNEIIAAAKAKGALYFYRPAAADGEQLRVELFAIRILPGPVQKVAVYKTDSGGLPLIAAAYGSGADSGIITLQYTEAGFAGGPYITSPGVTAASLTAGDVRPEPGEELVFGGEDGCIRVFAGSENPVLVTSNLGNSVTALACAKLLGREGQTLIAGTPEGYIFGFWYPLTGTDPDWALNIGRPLKSIAASRSSEVAAGTADGALFVWYLAGCGRSVHTVAAGDTIFSIAKQYGLTPSEVADASGLQLDETIYPGQLLVIP